VITIKINCLKDQADPITKVFIESGAIGVSELLFKINETKNLENDRTDVLVTFPVGFPYKAVILLLEHSILGFQLCYEKVDYEKFELPDFEPIQLSSRLTMIPDGNKIPVDTNIALKLSPGLGFGTGYHPTTRMCVQALELVNLNDTVLMDAGTGSGILAIAGMLLGAKQAIAFDIERQAVSAAKKNYALNKLSLDKASFHVADLSILDLYSFDILIANLLPNIFFKNAGYILAHLVEKCFILSGVNEESSERFESWLGENRVNFFKVSLEGWSMYSSFKV
jgi:ribosomal protein L11 methyltransferase